MSFDMGERAYHLAVSGDVFRWMVDYGSHETLQRVRISAKVVSDHTADLALLAASRSLRYICSNAAR